jgi:uncharacterized DUF497 family protein
MRYTFTWNPKKNRTNQRDHDGIDFDLASRVFYDADHLIEEDRIDEEGFERLHAIGRVPSGAVLLVVHIEKGEGENGEEIIHIISARKADHRAVRRYFQQAAQ